MFVLRLKVLSLGLKRLIWIKGVYFGFKMFNCRLKVFSLGLKVFTLGFNVFNHAD